MGVNSILNDNVSSVTENGFAAKSDMLLAVPDVLHDTDRVEYFKGYTEALLQAINTDKVPIKSYFAWSAYECFYLSDGDERYLGRSSDMGIFRSPGQL